MKQVLLVCIASTTIFTAYSCASKPKPRVDCKALKHQEDLRKYKKELEVSIQTADNPAIRAHYQEQLRATRRALNTYTRKDCIIL